ncbi:MAG: DUF3108 domain-containing protein, partial [Burkholderia sp.]|nr:DUF3108 domain-containing protein [Burkholderia sp.]
MAFPFAARSAEATVTPPDEPRARSRMWRWIVVLLVVGVLHWIAAQWVERHRATLNPSDDEHVPVQVALLKPERIERNPAAVPPAPAAQPATRKPAASKPREHVLTAMQSAERAAMQAARAASDAAASAAAANAMPASSASSASGAS